MESIKTKIEDSLYSYDVDKFMPVFEDGRLANRTEFVVYKAEQAASVLGHLAARTLEATIAAGSVILEHVAMEVE